MKEQKLIMIAAMICAIVSIQAGWWSASAQGDQSQPPTPPKPPADVLIERDVLIVAPPAPPAAPIAPQPGAPEIVMAKPGDDFAFSFISSEMSFDSQPVRGAPYSAEAVTEVTQTLSDGNRIVRKTAAAVHRDSAGRTRRDQTLAAIGPFATAGDAPQTILINDLVAGVNYILDPRTRTARKLILPPMRFGPVGGVTAPLPPEAPVVPAAAPGAPNIMAVKVRPLALKNALKKVEPIYPAAAKAAGAQGLVKVQVVANEAGEVVSASAVEGHSLLQPAAVEAVRQWRFRPLTTVGNHPMRVKSVVSFNFVLPAESNAVTVVEEGNFSPAAPPIEPVHESLGKQTIEGVEAEGTRNTFTIPENAIGNERPIKIINERWYAPALQVVVMTKRSDPRFGETVYRLININRNEPSSTLFEVPADYTLKEGPERFRMMKRIRE
ncbi:MAG: TonB family protein [Pyrinomonadaceae bacterium]